MINAQIFGIITLKKCGLFSLLFHVSTSLCSHDNLQYCTRQYHKSQIVTFYPKFLNKQIGLSKYGHVIKNKLPKSLNSSVPFISCNSFKIIINIWCGLVNKTSIFHVSTDHNAQLIRHWLPWKNIQKLLEFCSVKDFQYEEILGSKIDWSEGVIEKYLFSKFTPVALNFYIFYFNLGLASKF